ncbi:MAG: M16 family metallopeptidase [Pyrinomonadaceae bacterium]
MSLIKKSFLHLVVLSAMLMTAAAVNAQKTSPAPRQEKLLNGLKVLIWNLPSSETVTVKLRIHGGSAFDPQGKEGVMKMLSEGFFPTKESREFFEELGGGLEIDCNYDYIQVTARARNDEFLTVLETLSQSILGPEIGKDATSGLRAAVLEQLKEVEGDPGYIADRAVARRLFGTFPYGRPILGTRETLEAIDFADLRFAKDRLLTADNATLSIEGKVDPALAFRAARRYLGSWLKADKKIPSTFRQPDPPARTVEVLEVPGAGANELRFAGRGVSRSESDYYAALTLEKILAKRIQGTDGRTAFVRSEAHVLPGSLVFGVSGWQPSGGSGNGPSAADRWAESIPANVLSGTVSASEFDAAHREVLSELSRYDTAELWLDADTYKTGPAGKEYEKAAAVKPADVQRVLARLQKEPLAFVRVRPSANDN